MIWEEVLIDRNLTDEEIITGISKVFSVSKTDILIVDDIAEIHVGERFRIVCERTLVKGDFPLKLSIYLYDAKLAQLNAKVIIGRFCDILHCKCLIPDNSSNPYSMLLIQGSNKQQIVLLDPIRLDEDEEYILKKFL